MNKEVIQRMLEGEKPIRKSGRLINNTPTQILCIYGGNRKIEIEQMLLDLKNSANNVTVTVYIETSDGNVAVLSEYTKVCIAGEVSHVLEGSRLIVDDEYIYIYLTDAAAGPNVDDYIMKVQYALKQNPQRHDTSVDINKNKP